MPANVRLLDRLIVELRDGSRYLLRPGPYGKGIAIEAAGASPSASRRSADGSGGKSGRGRGRPPRASTVALRDTLAKHAAAGELQAAGHYIAWLRRQEPKISAASAQQIVARERRRAASENGLDLRRARRGRKAGRASKRPKRKSGQPGRQPAPATVMLRQRLATDQAAGKLHGPQQYVRWLVDAARIGIRQARPVVYRELKAAR